VPVSGNLTVDGLADLLRSRSVAAPAADAADLGLGEAPDGPGPLSADDLPEGQQPAGTAGRPPEESNLDDLPDGPEAGAGDPHPDARERRDQKTERRFAQLTAKIKEAQEEAARYKELAARYEAGEVPAGTANRPAPKAPLPPVERPSASVELETEISRTRSALAWLARNPNGGEVEVDGKMVEVTEEQVRAWQAELPSQLVELTVQREMELRETRARQESQRQSASADAAQVYPWLKDPEAPLNLKAVAFLKTLPPATVQALQALPNAHMMLGALITGMEARPALRAAARPAGARPTPQPTVPMGGGAAPINGNGVGSKVKAAQAKFDSSGSRADLEALLLAKQRAEAEALLTG
jgi:peptidoglycan hydrolase-like protein with peptidoglycan-binding domain